MNESIKRKVNRIGILGQVASIILIVLMVSAVLSTALASVLLFALPDQSVQLGFQGDFDLMVNKNLLGRLMDEITDADVQSIDAELRVNGRAYPELTMEKTAEGLAFHGESEQVTLDLSRFGWACLSATVYCAVLLVVFIFLKRLSDGFRRCDTPFSDDVIRRMSTFSWVLLIGSIISSIAQSVTNALISRNLSLEISLNPSTVPSCLHFSFSFTPILIALLVLFLTVIFRYGAQLQKESDETL